MVTDRSTASDRLLQLVVTTFNRSTDATGNGEGNLNVGFCAVTMAMMRCC